MTIDEAIGLSKAAADDMDLQAMPQFAKAVRMGIEALKREQILRLEIPYDRGGLLPGETPDENYIGHET